MKCVIHGSGGVGGYYGGCLARAGHEVFFIARGAHLEAIQQQGLSIKSAKGDFRIETPKSGERCDPNFDPDLVIVAVKSWQLPEITEEIKNYCTPSTLILPLQNGADASDILADTLGPEMVLGGLTKIFSKIEAPGVINHFTGATYIGFGEYFQDPQFQNAPDSLSDRCRNLEKELDSTPGIDAEAFVDIQKELWRKMLIFVSTSGVGTITRTPNGVFRSIPETREMLIQLIREILIVGQAKKVNIGEDDYEWAISTIDAMAPESNSSLFRDIQSNRPSELHSIHGFLVREAERLSVDVPALRFIYHCLIPQENLARES